MKTAWAIFRIVLSVICFAITAYWLLHQKYDAATFFLLLGIFNSTPS